MKIWYFTGTGRESSFSYIRLTSISNIKIVLPLQTVASKLHDTEVQVDILKTKAECDHVQFLITEKSNHGRIAPPAMEEIETLSLGKHSWEST